MSRIWLIAKREFTAYFASPIAYVAITAFLVVCGLKVFVIDSFLEQDEASLRSLFELVPVFFIFYLPAISMKSIADERRTGTFELLMTLPVTELEIVLGKYFGALGFMLVTLAVTGAYPVLVIILGAPDFGPMIGGYLGLFWVGATMLSLTVMTSAWTSNQIVAYVLAAMISALTYFQDQLLGVFWSGARQVMAFISLRAHFQNFTRGVVDSRDIVFFIAMTAFPLVIAAFSLSDRRWR
jgi:gliding motility-associated transport system permease protein